MAKRRRIGADRLPELLHTGHISMAGLADILHRLQGDPLSASRLRALAVAENKSALTGLVHEVDLPLARGGTWKWSFFDPGKLLADLVSRSPALQEAYHSAMHRNPPTPSRPWSLIIAWDEFIPGNKLATDQTRKTMVLSFSFLQSGFGLLSSGSVWCTPIIVRSNIISQVGEMPVACSKCPTPNNSDPLAHLDSDISLTMPLASPSLLTQRAHRFAAATCRLPLALTCELWHLM